MKPIHIVAQITEVEREIALRRSVYPGLVSRGKLRQAEADLHTAQMQAVLETMKWCERNSPLIHKIVAEEKSNAGAEVVD